MFKIRIMTELTNNITMVSNNIFNHPWIPNLDESIIKEMLSKIGIKDISELFNDIPNDIKIHGELRNIGFDKILSEYELDHIARREAQEIKTTDDFLVFTGGLCKHYVPYVIESIVSRAEFYTSYTPYQPEISQGMLQALFEYQSLMADLLEMDVVNASMYDGSTALAEAVLMSLRITKRKKVLVPKLINNEYYEVLKTYLEPHSIEISKIEYDTNTGLIDLSDLKKKLDEEVASVYVENPNFLGFIEEQVDEISDIVHENDSLLIIGVDPISLGVLRPPGKYGADIVVGEAQSLGLGLNYGGPYLGIFAVRDDYKVVRQMPGRLIGMTTSLDGEEIGFTMILQTREQHIRRERATSNICTNEALCALSVAVYLSLMGSSGLKKIGIRILKNSHYALDKISEINNIEAPLFSSSFFKQFPIHFVGKDVQDVNKILFKKGILGGLPLQNYLDGFANVALYCFSEVLSYEDIDYLVKVLKEVMLD